MTIQTLDVVLIAACQLAPRDRARLLGANVFNRGADERDPEHETCHALIEKLQAAQLQNTLRAV